MNRLKDKVIVVTGASSGIGRGIAVACAAEGADIVVNYRHSADKADQVVAEIEQLGQRAVAIQADMSVPDDIETLMDTSVQQMQRIDVWVNNAGADILTTSLADASVAEKLDQLIAVDLTGTINACHVVQPYFQQQGSGVFVNMSWDLAIHGFEGTNPQLFAATKAGVLGFTRSFAKSCGPTIRANVISPGWIATAFVEEAMAKDYYDARIAEIPLARFGRPEDVATAVVFLASDESAYITGEVIKINGGLV